MAKRSSPWGTIIIILLIIIFAISGYILLSTPSVDTPESITNNNQEKEHSSVPKHKQDNSQISEKTNVGDEEVKELVTEPETIGDEIVGFTFEGGLSEDDIVRIERIVNESQGKEEGASEYEFLQGSPVLSEDKSKVYFLAATANQEFVGIYEMLLEGYEWTRIYKHEYDSQPEIAILRVVGRDGENLVVLAGSWKDYTQRKRECYYPVLVGAQEDDGLLLLHIDEDPQTSLETYKLSNKVYQHFDNLYQDCSGRN